MGHFKKRLLFCALGVAALLALRYRDIAKFARAEQKRNEPPVLNVVVMDPLAAGLMPEEAPKYLRRDYQTFAKYLSSRLDGPVELAFVDSLGEMDRLDEVDLILGKDAAVRWDADQLGLRVRPIAMLTDQKGGTTVQGLFVVRPDDKAKTLRDRYEFETLFGPRRTRERHDAAMDALIDALVILPSEAKVAETDAQAALGVVNGDADLAVLSDYALEQLEQTGTIKKDALRVIGRTREVPFISAFVTDRVSRQRELELIKLLDYVDANPDVCKALHSRSGFVTTEDPRCSIVIEWPQVRGPMRDGVSWYVPKNLPARARYRWSTPMSGVGLSAVAATDRHVIVADKGPNRVNDIWRCLDADTGEQLWQVSYQVLGELDHDNSPRAGAVIGPDAVYLLGSHGDLVCAQRRSGRVLWKTNLREQFQAEMPARGYAAAPILVGDKLIVNPGAEDASLVALDRKTGEAAWRTPGAGAVGADFVYGRFGGVDQVVGFDAVSLGGWDPQTGERLWSLPASPTGEPFQAAPVNVAGGLLVCDAEGLRLYGFDEQGRVKPEPTASLSDVKPRNTPVAAKGLIFAAGDGALHCLDADQGLKSLWSWKDAVFRKHVSLIAGGTHILVSTLDGELILLEIDRGKPTVVSRRTLFGRSGLWSHPALIRDRLFLRSHDSVTCFVLDDTAPAITDQTQAMTLFDGESMGRWKKAGFLGSGEVALEDGAMVLKTGHDMTGITWTGPLIRMNYEISLDAQRVEGSDFFCGLTFPVGRDPISLICGGWGGTVVGLSSLDYYDAANNETGTSKRFENGQWYSIRVAVTPDRIRVWIDGDELINLITTGRTLGIRHEIDPCRPLGVATWQTTGAVRNIRIRRIDGSTTFEGSTQ